MLVLSNVETVSKLFPFTSTLIDDSDDSGKFSYDTKLIKNFAKRCFIRRFRTEVLINLILHIDLITYHGVSSKREFRVYRVIRSHIRHTCLRECSPLAPKIVSRKSFLSRQLRYFCKDASRRCLAKVSSYSLAL